MKEVGQPLTESGLSSDGQKPFTALSRKTQISSFPFIALALSACGGGGTSSTSSNTGSNSSNGTTSSGNGSTSSSGNGSTSGTISDGDTVGSVAGAIGGGGGGGGGGISLLRLAIIYHYTVLAATM